MLYVHVNKILHLCICLGIMLFLSQFMFFVFCALLCMKLLEEYVCPTFKDTFFIKTSNPVFPYLSLLICRVVEY